MTGSWSRHSDPLSTVIAFTNDMADRRGDHRNFYHLAADGQLYRPSGQGF
jgi:hypothetical protein